MGAHIQWGIMGDFGKRVLGFITGLGVVLSALGESIRIRGCAQIICCQKVGVILQLVVLILPIRR